MRLLIVDDEPMLLLALQRSFRLEQPAWEVVLARSGQEALDSLADGLAVDLVILDMRMPGLGGAETLPRLRALRPGLPVLLATGHADRDLPPLLAAHPGVASIQKPFTLAEIRDKLGELAAGAGPIP